MWLPSSAEEVHVNAALDSFIMLFVSEEIVAYAHTKLKIPFAWKTVNVGWLKKERRKVNKNQLANYDLHYFFFLVRYAALQANKSASTNLVWKSN